MGTICPGASPLERIFICGLALPRVVTIEHVCHFHDFPTGFSLPVRHGHGNSGLDPCFAAARRVAHTGARRGGPESARGSDAAFPAEGEARRALLSERWPVARRYVRSKTFAGEVCGAAVARRVFAHRTQNGRGFSITI